MKIFQFLLTVDIIFVLWFSHIPFYPVYPTLSWATSWIWYIQQQVTRKHSCSASHVKTSLSCPILQYDNWCKLEHDGAWHTSQYLYRLLSLKVPLLIGTYKVTTWLKILVFFLSVNLFFLIYRINQILEIA